MATEKVQLISVHTIHRDHPKTGNRQEIAPNTLFYAKDEDEQDYLVKDAKAAKVYVPEQSKLAVADDSDGDDTPKKETAAAKKKREAAEQKAADAAKAADDLV